MKRALLLLLLVGLSLADCVNNGICESSEKGFGCDDCAFLGACNNDGLCSAEEIGTGCSDCAAVQAAKCVEDDVCTDAERELGCSDCEFQMPSFGTGLMIFAGGVSLLGFLVLFIIAAVAMAVYGMGYMQNRGIKL